MNSQKYSRVIIIFLIGVVSLLFLHPTSLSAKSKSKVIYRDDKNNYFFFVPPKGWTIEKYSDPRTKVAFHHPDEHNVLLRFIVREVPGYTFLEMKRDAEEVCQTWRGKGVIFELKETEILGVKGITLTTGNLLPNLYSRILKCIKFGIHFSVAFHAPKTTFRKYLEEVTKSINSIVVLKPASLDAGKAKQQQIGHYIRSAELISEMGDHEEACNILKELMREFPNDKNVQRTFKKLKCE